MASKENIVTFGIAVSSRATSTSWARVEHFLRATVGSIYAQSDQAFRVIICCTDEPDLSDIVDERTDVIFEDQVPCVSYADKNLDAGRKWRRIARFHREAGGGYLMFVDSDDLVSSQLVAFIRSQGDRNGYLVTHGYALDAQSGEIAPLPNPHASLPFDQLCGTSAVLNYSRDDLPTELASVSGFFERVVQPGHGTVGARAREAGRPLMDLPFRAAVFVRNTGENVSLQAESGGEKPPYFDYHARLLSTIRVQSIARTHALEREFNLNAADHSDPRSRKASLAGLPGISILVATYKRPQGLRRLLDRLVLQVRDHPEREIIIVNDGTHDEAYQAVVDAFQNEITYVALPENIGVGGARQHAASLAKRDFIVFTDDDCEPPRWWLDWLSARLLCHPELDVVMGTTRPLPTGRNSFAERVQVHYGFIPRPWKAGEDTIFVTANVAIRRQTFERVGGIAVRDKRLRAGEDTELSGRLRQGGAASISDPDWYVRHEVGDTLRTQIKRYWGYGFANVTIAHLPTVPAIHLEFAKARRRDLPHQLNWIVREMTRRSAGFSRNPAARLASIAAASAIQLAHFFGCVAAARESGVKADR